jgi:hypothetical protein
MRLGSLSSDISKGVGSVPSYLGKAAAIGFTLIVLNASGHLFAGQASWGGIQLPPEGCVPVTEIPSSPEAVCFCGETWSKGNDFNTDYWHWDMDGKDVAYRVEIPAYSRLIVTVYPNSCWAPELPLPAIHDALQLFCRSPRICFSKPW